MKPMLAVRSSLQAVVLLGAAALVMAGPSRAADAAPVFVSADASVPDTAASALGATLPPLLALAQSHNPRYLSARADADAAAERPISAGALPEPRLRVELRDITNMGDDNPSLSPSQVGSTRYVLTQTLPWFGKRDLARQIAELEALSVSRQAESTWNDVAAAIKGVQAQRYFVAANTRLVDEMLTLTRQIEVIAKTRYSHGLAAQQDVIRVQSELTDQQSALIALNAQSRQLDARLNGLIGRDGVALLAPAQTLPPLPAPNQLAWDRLQAQVLAHNPLLAAQQHAADAARQSRELTYKNRYPDVSLGIAPVQRGDSFKEWELMVEMNLPIQFESRSAQEREAQARVVAADERRQSAATDALATLADNLAGLDSATQTATLVAHTLLPQVQATFEAALAGYENGQVDFATLLDAQRQIRQARQNLIEAEAQSRIRLAEVERLAGGSL